MADERALLERYNPALVLYPQDPTRARPGAFRPEAGWGDYHPCNVEFMLDRVTRRDRPPSYDYRGLLLLTRWRKQFWGSLVPDRLGPLRQTLASVEPEETTPWELNVSDLPSQDEEGAWNTYARYLNGSPVDGEPFRWVTYARYVEGRSGRALQYWYCYVYNDFLNNHEGDWEMATIVLGGDDRPVEVAYSNHHGGLRLPWEEVRRDGDHPLLYVSRGSHAGTFSYKSGGHPIGGELSTGSVPRAFAFLLPIRGVINTVIRALQRIPGFRVLRDFPPADPEQDRDADAEHLGVRVLPEVEVLPRIETVTPDSDFWWLRYRGRWGSTSPRLSGSVGVVGPWAGSPTDLRWPDPVAWAQSCTVAEPPGVLIPGVTE